MQMQVGKLMCDQILCTMRTKIDYILKDETLFLIKNKNMIK